MTDNDAQRVAELEREIEDLKRRIAAIEKWHQGLDNGIRKMLEEDRKRDLDRQ